jgi:MFS transporter, DHA1 family, solute carrier family 18 (vesicular amine transporter), member 1/2
MVWGLDPMAMADKAEDEEKGAKGDADQGGRSTESEDNKASDQMMQPKGQTADMNVSQTSEVKELQDAQDPSNSTAPSDQPQNSFPQPGPAPMPPNPSDAAPGPEPLSIPPATPPAPLSPLGVLIKLATSARSVTVMANTLIYGVAYSAQEPALPLHMQATWGYGAGKVGVVMIAAVVPTLFSSPLSGWYTDRRGTGASPACSRSLPSSAFALIRRVM